MNTNQCPSCGGVANHIITDIVGRTYYRCMTGLTSFKEEGGGGIGRASQITPCDTIIYRGKKFTGTIAFVTGGKEETLAVTDGKERR